MNKFNFKQQISMDSTNCYIIAEIGQAHDGSLGSAFSYIDAVAETGVDAVKFQTHIASAESTRHEQFRVKVFPQDETRYDYWKRMEFTANQWKELADYAIKKGLDFLSTPFSIEAVQLLDEIGVPAWKIGSGDIGNTALIAEILKTRKPILLSSGMSSFDELDRTIQMINNAGVEFALFQCTTSYPCSAESIGYNVITEMKERYNCPVGLSDHSGTIFPSLAALTIGAKLIEVHTVFSKRCFGPDTMSSLTIEQLAQLVEGVRFIEKGLKNPINKLEAAEGKKETKELFSRSAFYIENILEGTVLTDKHFSMKKPGGGLTYEEAIDLIGKKINKNRSLDDFMKLGDFT